MKDTEPYNVIIITTLKTVEGDITQLSWAENIPRSFLKTCSALLLPHTFSKSYINCGKVGALTALIRVTEKLKVLSQDTLLSIRSIYWNLTMLNYLKNLVFKKWPKHKVKNYELAFQRHDVDEVIALGEFTGTKSCAMDEAMYRQASWHLHSNLRRPVFGHVITTEKE